jgi:hypothetical protein
MSRTQTINETLDILGKLLPEAGHKTLDAERLHEIYAAIERFATKKERDELSQELGFTVRKRSAVKAKDPDAPEKKPRKTGYSCFPGESHYLELIEDIAGTADEDGKTITKLKAKATIWKTLSEEQKEPFNQNAAASNRDNGLPEKKNTSPKDPKLTLAQTVEQLRLTQELLRLQGVQDMPQAPPKELKQKKNKNSQKSSPQPEEEELVSPTVQSNTDIHLGTDTDSEASDTPTQVTADDYNHIRWTISIVNDSDEDGPKADFIAWLISERPDEFGPTNRNTLFNDEEIKPLKKQYDFKNNKKNPLSLWYDFIKIHSDE